MAACDGSPLTIQQRFSEDAVVLEGCNLVDASIQQGETTTVEFTVRNDNPVRAQLEYGLDVGPRTRGGTVAVEGGQTVTESVEIGQGLGPGDHEIVVRKRGAADISANARLTASGRGGCGCGCGGCNDAQDGVGTRLRHRARLRN